MNFEEAVGIILKHEGAYINHKSDPGGETNFGISKRAYPHLNIKTLTIEDAKKIYKRDYWDKSSCDELPEIIRLLVFDAAVNHGVGKAKIFLEAAKKVSKTDHDLILNFALVRFKSYSANSRWSVFGKGWAKRLIESSILSFRK